MASGDLVINMIARVSQFTGPIQAAQSRIKSFTSSAVANFARLGLAINGVESTIRTLGSLALPVKMAAQAETTAIAFEVMTGSVETANKLIADLRKAGAATPFEFTDLSTSSKTLLQFGRTANQVMSDLHMISNIASGDAQKLQSLSLVFGQIAANGRLTGGDLLQLINAGFNPLQEIAKRTGETMVELRDRMSKGKIGFDEVRKAFDDATAAGGRFHKMNERMSKTLEGRWSTFKDEVNTALMEVGVAISEEFDLKEVTQNMTKFVQTFKSEWMPDIISVIKDLRDFLKDTAQFLKDANDFAKNLNVSPGDLQVLTPGGAMRAMGGSTAGNPSRSELEDAMRRKREADRAAMFLPADGVMAAPAQRKMSLLEAHRIAGDPNDPRFFEGPQLPAGGIHALEAMRQKSFVGPTIDEFALRDRNKAESDAVASGIVSALDSMLSQQGPIGKQMEAKIGDVRSLERDSMENFEVLRAGTTLSKGESEQIKIAKEQSKILKLIEKGVTKNTVNTEIILRGEL